MRRSAPRSAPNGSSATARARASPRPTSWPASNPRPGQFPTRIEKVDPPHYLAYRRASGYPGDEATEHNSTLVEFTLTPDGDGTRLHLAESGFATVAIPEDRRATASRESHSSGWTDVLATMRGYAERPAA